MNGLTNGIGINVDVERNWTWVSGNTYPIKEELKQQGFFWSVKRRAWYNRGIVEVKLNGNGHGIKPTEHTKEHAQEAKTPIEMVKTKVKEKTLEEEVFEYIKTKEAYPLISGEWLSKQEKLGRTFFQLKPQIDDLIEEFLETEKRVKEPEKEKDLHDWAIARNKELSGAEQIKDPHKRIEKVNEIVKRYNETADKNRVTSEQYAAQIRVKAKREIWKTKQEEELSEHDKALLEGDYKIEGKLPSEEKKAWRTEEYEKTVNELKERFGMLNPM